MKIDYFMRTYTIIYKDNMMYYIIATFALSALWRYIHDIEGYILQNDYIVVIEPNHRFPIVKHIDNSMINSITREYYDTCYVS